MGEYRTLFAIRRVMPDDRLVHAKVDDDGVMAFYFRARCIHPALVHEMGVLSTRIAESGVFSLDPSKVGEDPRFGAWLARVAAEDWPPDQLLACRINAEGPFFEIQLRAEVVTPELVREMNEEALPAVTGALVPVMSAPV